MFKQKIFVASFIALDLIAIFHYLGLKYNLYWIYKWYDIPMHIFGGFWISLFFLSVYSYYSQSYYNNIKVFLMVSSVLILVIVTWEMFEFLNGITIFSNNRFWFDSIKDIMSGFVGGMMGYSYYLIDRVRTVKLKANFNIKI